MDEVIYHCQNIDKDEFDGIFGHGRGSTGPLYNKLLQTEVNKGFKILQSEWGKKYPPTTVINRVMRSHKMKFSWIGLPDRSGWAVLRVS